jgi:hypothetical protein
MRSTDGLYPYRIFFGEQSILYTTVREILYHIDRKPSDFTRWGSEPHMIAMFLYGMDIRIQHFFLMIQNLDQAMDPEAFAFLQNSFSSIQEALAIGNFQQNLPAIRHRSYHDPLHLVYYNYDGELRPSNRPDARQQQRNQQ